MQSNTELLEGFNGSFTDIFLWIIDEFENFLKAFFYIGQEGLTKNKEALNTTEEYNLLKSKTL